MSSSTTSQPPPSETTTWLDAKGFLDAVCKELKPGQMVHDEHFSLIEAMSAIEIGDPKMDQGARLANSPDATMTFPQLLDAYAPVALDPSKLLPVCDAMMAAEVTWYNGATLPQSLFSALYLHDLDRCVCSICGAVALVVYLLGCHEMLQHMFVVNMTLWLPLTHTPRIKTKQPLLYAYCVSTLATAKLVRDIHLQSTVTEVHYHPLLMMSGHGAVWDSVHRGCMLALCSSSSFSSSPLLVSPPWQYIHHIPLHTTTHNTHHTHVPPPPPKTIPPFYKTFQ